MRIALITFLIATLSFQSSNDLFIEGKFSRMAIDELGNIYALRGDVMELYRPDGNFWMRNSIKTIGQIHQMDVFYSLKPMLYSRDLQQLVVLDNTLSIQGDLIWLNRRGFPQVNLVSSSVMNHFWLFDQLDMQLMRVDRQWTKVAESGRLDQILGFAIEPIEIIEFDNLVYLVDPENGLLVFDLFGTYVKTIPLTQASNVQVGKRWITYMKGGKAHAFDRLDLESVVLDLPPGIKMFYRAANSYLYLSDSGIHRKSL